MFLWMSCDSQLVIVCLLSVVNLTDKEHGQIEFISNMQITISMSMLMPYAVPNNCRKVVAY